MGTTQKCYELSWTNSWFNNPRKYSCMATYLPSQKPSNKEEKRAGNCWRSKDKLLRDVLLWTLTHGWASVGGPKRTYLHQICTNTRFSLEKQPGAMDESDRWREWEGKRVRERERERKRESQRNSNCQYNFIDCKQQGCFMYYDLTLIILVTITHLFVLS